MKTYEYAYVIATLKKNAQGAWAMTEIDVFSAPAWGLTTTSRNQIYAQIHAPYPAATYHDACIAARQDMEKNPFFSHLKRYFRWLNRS